MTGYHSDNDVIELRRLFRFFGKTRAVNDVSFSVSRAACSVTSVPTERARLRACESLQHWSCRPTGMHLSMGFRSLMIRSTCVGGWAHARRVRNLPRCKLLGIYRLLRSGIRTCRTRTSPTGSACDGLTRLGGIAEKPIRGLSKGMKQRLCLGRALVHDPAVMILDEPAAGLDPRARIELRRMIRELADEGKTILVSSHILTELAEMCDSVGIIEQGTLLATGSVAEIQEQQENVREFVVRIVDQLESGVAILQSNSHVRHLFVDGELVRFEFLGEMEHQIQMLKELVQRVSRSRSLARTASP